MVINHKNKSFYDSNNSTSYIGIPSIFFKNKSILHFDQQTTMPKATDLHRSEIMWNKIRPTLYGEKVSDRVKKTIIPSQNYFDNQVIQACRIIESKKRKLNKTLQINDPNKKVCINIPESEQNDKDIEILPRIVEAIVSTLECDKSLHTKSQGFNPMSYKISREIDPECSLRDESFLTNPCIFEKIETGKEFNDINIKEKIGEKNVWNYKEAHFKKKEHIAKVNTVYEKIVNLRAENDIRPIAQSKTKSVRQLLSEIDNHRLNNTIRKNMYPCKNFNKRFESIKNLLSDVFPIQENKGQLKEYETSNSSVQLSGLQADNNSKPTPEHNFHLDDIHQKSNINKHIKFPIKEEIEKTNVMDKYTKTISEFQNPFKICSDEQHKFNAQNQSSFNTNPISFCNEKIINKEIQKKTSDKSLEKNEFKKIENYDTSNPYSTNVSSAAFLQDFKNEGTSIISIDNNKDINFPKSSIIQSDQNKVFGVEMSNNIFSENILTQFTTTNTQPMYDRLLRPASKMNNSSKISTENNDFRDNIGFPQKSFHVNQNSFPLHFTSLSSCGILYNYSNNIPSKSISNNINSNQVNTEYNEENQFLANADVISSHLLNESAKTAITISNMLVCPSNCGQVVKPHTSTCFESASTINSSINNGIIESNSLIGQNVRTSTNLFSQSLVTSGALQSLGISSYTLCSSVNTTSSILSRSLTTFSNLNFKSVSSTNVSNQSLNTSTNAINQSTPVSIQFLSGCETFGENISIRNRQTFESNIFDRSCSEKVNNLKNHLNKGEIFSDCNVAISKELSNTLAPNQTSLLSSSVGFNFSQSSNGLTFNQNDVNSYDNYFPQSSFSFGKYLDSDNQLIGSNNIHSSITENQPINYVIDNNQLIFCNLMLNQNCDKNKTFGEILNDNSSISKNTLMDSDKILNQNCQTSNEFISNFSTSLMTDGGFDFNQNSINKSEISSLSNFSRKPRNRR